MLVPREFDRCAFSSRTSSGNSEKESSPSLSLFDGLPGPGGWGRITKTRCSAKATSSTSVSELPRRRITCYETARGQPSHRPRLEITAPLAAFVQGFATVLAATFKCSSLLRYCYTVEIFDQYMADIEAAKAGRNSSLTCFVREARTLWLSAWQEKEKEAACQEHTCIAGQRDSP